MPAGSSCALVGPSGAGKSTIVALLLRFYDPQAGAIRLDGVDIRTLNVAWLRSQLGLVSQEPVLFQGTVAENIGHGKPGATAAEVEEAAAQAHALDFIRTDLSDGFGTQVGQGGSKLSGGQKQRIAIARALIRKPAVLLLDEATSALDNKNERAVQAAMDTIVRQQQSTCLIIAHRLSTIRHASSIAVVSEGRVVEQGSYDALLAIGAGGRFHALASRYEQHNQEDALPSSNGAAMRAQTSLPSEPESVAVAVAVAGASAPSASAVAEGTGERAGGSPAHAVDVEAGAGGGDAAHGPAADVTAAGEVAAGEAAAGEAAAGEYTKKALAKRMLKLYRPNDNKRLSFAMVGAVLGGVATSLMGLLVVYAAFPFRDQADPNKLERQVVLWCSISFGLGVGVHCLDAAWRTSFVVASEGLTRRLRVLAMERLLRQEMGYFDEEANSAGALSEFLETKVSLVQGLNEAPAGLSFFAILISVCVVSSVFGDVRIFAIFFVSYVATMAMLVSGQMITGSQEERYKAQGAEADEPSAEQRAAGGLIGEVVGAMRTAASLNMQRAFLSQYTERIAHERRRQTGVRMYFGVLLMGFGMAFMMLCMSLALYYGFWLIANDPMSFLGARSLTGGGRTPDLAHNDRRPRPQ